VLFDRDVWAAVGGGALTRILLARADECFALLDRFDVFLAGVVEERADRAIVDAVLDFHCGGAARLRWFVFEGLLAMGTDAEITREDYLLVRRTHAGSYWQTGFCPQKECVDRRVA
jgi:hypothetical protein